MTLLYGSQISSTYSLIRLCIKSYTHIGVFQIPLISIHGILHESPAFPVPGSCFPVDNLMVMASLLAGSLNRSTLSRPLFRLSHTIEWEIRQRTSIVPGYMSSPP